MKILYKIDVKHIFFVFKKYMYSIHSIIISTKHDKVSYKSKGEKTKQQKFINSIIDIKHILLPLRRD